MVFAFRLLVKSWIVDRSALLSLDVILTFESVDQTDDYSERSYDYCTTRKEKGKKNSDLNKGKNPPATLRKKTKKRDLNKGLHLSTAILFFMWYLSPRRTFFAFSSGSVLCSC